MIQDGTVSVRCHWDISQEIEKIHIFMGKVSPGARQLARIYAGIMK